MKLFVMRWFASVLFVFVFVGMSGCASLTKSRYIKRDFQITAPKDIVWEGVINYFSVKQIPISESEKSKGKIYAERSIQASIKDDKYAKCPKGRMLGPRRTKMNILVTELDVDLTNITINLQFQRAYVSSNIYGENLGDQYYECESTGVGEREIYQSILDYVANRPIRAQTTTPRNHEIDIN